MITLTSTTAAMLYLCLTLATLLGLWGGQHCRSRKKKIDVSDQELLVCEYCLFAYLDDKSKRITRCPQCQSYNIHKFKNREVREGVKKTRRKI